MGRLESDSYKLRWLALERDNFTCRYCGQSAPDAVLVVNYVNPNLDTRNQLDNLVTICFACSLGRGIKQFVFSVKTRQPHIIKKQLVIDRLVAYFQNNPANSATAIAPIIGINRSTVARALSTNPLFKVSSKQGKSVLYTLS